MEVPELPSRIFAAGEEPIGERVSSYNKTWRIKSIVNALEEEELEYLRGTPFGKLLTLQRKPSFSGRFMRYIMSRQLKVSKKHEIWFLFAGKPIRFSIREFAVVTGLNCGKLPEESKKKKNAKLKEKPYWPVLFGNLDSITVDRVTRMLRKKTVTDKDVRMKYACLALVSGVLLPTAHTPKIGKVHVEMIQDLDEFFRYPWGRLAFNMMMGSIKARDVVELSQRTLVVKGFALAIQLVLTEAVPALVVPVIPGGAVSSDSETDGDNDADNDGENEVDKEESFPKMRVPPVHARLLCEAGNVEVECIISGEPDGPLDVTWDGGAADEKVDTLVELINKDYVFSKNMFSGGLTRAEVARLKKEKEDLKKKQKASENVVENLEDVIQEESSGGCPNPNMYVDVNLLAGLVADKIASKMKSTLDILTVMRRDISEVETNILAAMDTKLSDFRDEILVVGQRDSVRSEHLGDPVGMTKSKFPPSCSVGLDNASEPDCLVDDLNPVDDPFSVGDPRHVCDPTPAAEEVICASDVATGTIASVLGELDGVTRGTNRMTDKSKGDTGPELDPLVKPGAQSCNNGRAEEDCETGDEVDVGLSRRVSKRQKTIASDVATGTIASVLGALDGVTRGTNFTADKSKGDTGPVLDPLVKPGAQACNNGSAEELGASASEDCETGDEVNGGLTRRVSKRQKTFPANLIDNYQCDQRTVKLSKSPWLTVCGADPSVDYAEKFGLLATKIPKSYTIKINNSPAVIVKDIVDVGHRLKQLPVKVVDALMHHTRVIYDQCAIPAEEGKSLFLGSKFAPALLKIFCKFSSAPSKGKFSFPKNILHLFQLPNQEGVIPNRLYFPFNFDKLHWVGVCVDLPAQSFLILDYNLGLRSEVMIRKEFSPIAQMIPFIVNQITGRGVKYLTFERVKGIPHNGIHVDSAATAVLLMQYHAIGGVEACKQLHPEFIAAEAQKLAVVFFETHGEVLYSD